MSDYYQVLDLASDATPTEVRQRYRALKHLYEDDLGSYGLVNDDERAATLAAIEEAFAVLSDPQRRQRYDEELAATGHPGPWYRDLQPSLPLADNAAMPSPDAPSAEVGATPAPPVSVASPPRSGLAGDEVPQLSPERIAELEAVIAKSPKHGAYLRAVRERSGISLATVSQALKITVTQLENIECHRFEKLPALVYLKGFLRSYARYLRVNEEEVVSAYLELRASWEELES